MIAFELDAPQVMGEMCAAITALLAECRCQPSGTYIAERLGLDKMLAWHLAQIAGCDNPLLIAHHIPGSEGVKLCLAGFARAGASREALDRLQAVFQRYQQLKANHAGDQQRLDSMLASSVGRLAESRSLALARAAAFRANSIIFGIAATTLFKADFIADSADGTSLDFCSLTGTAHLARFRRDASWELSRSAFIDEQRPADLKVAGPLDVEAFEKFNVPLLQRFSNLPPVPFTVTPEGGLRHSRYLDSSRIGLGGRSTIVLGEYARGLAHPYAQMPNEHGDVFLRLYTPASLMIHDLLIHNRLLETAWRDVSPQWFLVGELGCGLLFPVGSERKTPIPVQPVEVVGPAAATPAVPNYPRYQELLGFAASAMNWQLDGFTMFRARLKYPPVPSTSVLRIKLPARG